MITSVIGNRVNNYIILQEFRENGKNKVKCLCDCGKEFILPRASISGKNAKKSCGCLNKKKDLTGLKFNRWTVLSFHSRGNDVYYWKSQCDCGVIKLIPANTLTKNRSLSCGCYRSEQVTKAVLKDLTGLIFGGLHVIRRDANHNKHRLVKWLCECRCGNFISAMAKNLLSGHAKKCGKCTRTYKYYPFWDAPPIRRRANPNNLYIRWRKDVFKRDNYQCQICGKNSGIVAHHLDGWNWAASKRYEVSNGCVLCDNGVDGCHNRFHKKYGCGDNTKAQFEEFKKICTEIANYSVGIHD